MSSKKTKQKNSSQAENPCCSSLVLLICF